MPRIAKLPWEPDLQDLRGSGLSNATIVRNGIRTTFDADEIFSLLGCGPNSQAALGGLLIPYRNLKGEVNCFARMKPHNPVKDAKGRVAKYLSPKDSGLRAFFPAECVDDLREGGGAVDITEGEKKALALAQIGRTAVGLGGIWCGCRKNEQGEHVLIDDLAAIPWAGRDAFIVFDHEPKAATRTQVDRARRRLAAALRKAGAREVFSVDLGKVVAR
ncbi:MAG: DUF3854 domain-containing protein [Gemmataceae bacterium]